MVDFLLYQSAVICKHLEEKKGEELNQIRKGFFHLAETGDAQIEEGGDDSKAEQEAG